MKTSMKKFLKVSVALVLVAVMALAFASCSKPEADAATGTKTITVEVIDNNGESVDHVITTEAENLADALLAEGIVEGDDGEYGLYITTVDGLVADYSVDGSFWSISKDGEMLMTGASSTEIADGEHYELTYTIYN